MNRGFFVTGTDTGVGKTLVSAILALGLRAAYWKPIQSGMEPTTDTKWVRDHTGLGNEYFYPEAYCLEQPLSPHASAAIQGVRISLDGIRLPSIASRLIVEGAGGVMVPLNEESFIIDLIHKLELPCVIVARSALGTINHTLLTIAQLRSYNIPIHGVVMNGERNPSNRKAIEQYGKVPVLAEIEPQPLLNSSVLQNLYQREFQIG